jgi:hypothetical protein
MRRGLSYIAMKKQKDAPPQARKHVHLTPTYHEHNMKLIEYPRWYQLLPKTVLIFHHPHCRCRGGSS